LHFVRPTNLDTDGRPWTFWKHSQGAGIETRAAHQTAHQKNWLFVLVDPNGRNTYTLEKNSFPVPLVDYFVSADCLAREWNRGTGKT